MVDFPTGWVVEQKEDHIEARSPHDAELRIATFALADSGTSAKRWAETAAHVDRAKGREVAPARFGDFRGYETRFESGGQYFHAWALAADDLPLDILYRCPEQDAGREDVELNAVLATLRRTAA